MMRYGSIFRYVLLSAGVSCLATYSLSSSGPVLLTKEERVAHNKALYGQIEELVEQVPEIRTIYSIMKKLSELQETSKQLYKDCSRLSSTFCLSQVISVNDFRGIQAFVNDSLVPFLDTIGDYLNQDIINFDNIDDLKSHINTLQETLKNVLKNSKENKNSAETENNENHELNSQLFGDAKTVSDHLYKISKYFYIKGKFDYKMFNTLFESHQSKLNELVRTQGRCSESIPTFARVPTREENQILAPVQAAFPGAEILIVDAPSYLRGLAHSDYFLNLLTAPAEEFRQALNTYFFPVVEISPEARPLIGSYCHAAETDLYYRRILVGLMANLQTPLSLRRMMFEFPRVALKLAIYGRYEENAFDIPLLKIQGIPQYEHGPSYEDNVVSIDTTREACRKYACFMTDIPQDDQERLYENIGVSIAKWFDLVAHEFGQYLAEVISKTILESLASLLISPDSFKIFSFPISLTLPKLHISGLTKRKHFRFQGAQCSMLMVNLSMFA